MFNLVRQADFVIRAFEVFTKEGREGLHQIAGALAIAADHRHQGIQGIEQEMRIDLRMQQLDLRLCQQLLVALVLSGHDLRRQQAGDAFAQRTIDGAEQLAFRFVQFDGADHPLVFAAQRITSVDPSLQAGLIEQQ